MADENSARISALEEELRGLRRDVVLMHERMGDILEGLRTGETAELPASLIPAPAEPQPPLLRRAFGRARRILARTIRSAIALVHPCSEKMCSLVYRSVEKDVILPDDLVVTGEAPDEVLLHDLPWLFALENIDGAWDRVFTATRNGTGYGSSPHAGSHLLAAAEKAGRPLIFRRLDGPAGETIDEEILYPVPADNSPALYRTESFDIVFPSSTRRAEMLLDTGEILRPGDFPEFPWALLLARDPVCGLFERIASAIEHLGPGLIISLAGFSELGRRRFRDLEKLRCRTHDFGHLLHRVVRCRATAAAVGFSGARAIWVVGDDPAGECVGLLRKTTDLRILQEKISPGGEISFELDGDELTLPPAFPTAPALPIDPETIRRKLKLETGDHLIAVIDDLASPARPEDMILVADELRKTGEEITISWVGEGPMESRVRDLAGLFRLRRFFILPPGERDSVLAAASLVCHPGESPELPPGVIRAVEFRVPVVVPSHGPLAFIDAPGVTRAGVPGDISAMARVVRTLLEKDRPSAEMTASFAENKPFGAALRRILMDE